MRRKRSTPGWNKTDGGTCRARQPFPWRRWLPWCRGRARQGRPVVTSYLAPRRRTGEDDPQERRLLLADRNRRRISRSAASKWRSPSAWMTSGICVARRNDPEPLARPFHCGLRVSRETSVLAATAALLSLVAILAIGHGRLAMTLQTQPAIEPRELADEERAAKLRELLDSEPLPMIQKSIDAFRRDLPARRAKPPPAGRDWSCGPWSWASRPDDKSCEWDLGQSIPLPAERLEAGFGQTKQKVMMALGAVVSHAVDPEIGVGHDDRARGNCWTIRRACSASLALCAPYMGSTCGSKTQHARRAKTVRGRGPCRETGLP